MPPEWMSSPEAFKKQIDEQNGFNSSIGLTNEVAHAYQSELFAGNSREDALQSATVGLELKNHVTWQYVREALENLPGPGEV
jgi:hypothetical protein